MSETQTKCPSCWAYFPEGYPHKCDGPMLGLVKIHTDRRIADLKARVAEMEAKLHSANMDGLAYFGEAANLRATLAQRDREVLALREGLGSSPCECGEYRGFDRCERCAALASTAQAGAEAERRIRQDEREKAAKAVDAVEELPGHMPDEMWAAIQNDRDAFEEALRITVRQSKCEAKAAILGTEPNP